MTYLSRTAAVIGMAFVAVTGLSAPVELPPNPVTNGGFEVLRDNGFPEDWDVVGDNVRMSQEAHSGRSALVLTRTPDAVAQGTEDGINRAWMPESGAQGAMLPQLRGGLRFWYKAVAAPPEARLMMYAIPMNDEPFERTGLPRACFQVPAGHIGDGQWHEGLLGYDFTGNDSARYVQVSPRLQGPAGSVLILDDISWVESVGPVPVFSSMKLYPRPDGTCQLRCLLTNGGDAPFSGTLSVALPAGLRAAQPPLTRDVTELLPTVASAVAWDLQGTWQAGGVIRAVLAGNGPATEERLVLTPLLAEVFMLADRFALWPGEETDIEIKAWNRGTAIVPSVSLSFQLPDGLATVGALPTQIRDVPPHGFAGVRCRVRADKQMPLMPLRCVWQLPGPHGSSGTARCELVVGSPPDADADAPAVVAGGFEIRFPRNRFGYGIGWIRTLPDGELVGVIPSLGRLRMRGGPDEGVPLYARASEVVSDGQVLGGQAASPHGRGLRFAVPVAMPGTPPGSTISVSFVAPADDSTGDVPNTVITCRVSAPVPSPGTLLGLETPFVCAGEGAARAREEALVPGLEWLVGDDMSSSDLDIAYDHEHRLRYRQHPHLITVPFMAVRTAAATTGIVWHPRAHWNDGKQRPELAPDRSDVDRPTPVFASPDRFNGHASHTMGLALPTVPEYAAANEEIADTGWPVAGSGATRLDLSFGIYVLPGGDTALDACRLWFDIYGAPAPRPPPRAAADTVTQGPAVDVYRGSRLPDWALGATPDGAWLDPGRDAWIGELAWSMGAYLETLWNEEDTAWWNFNGGPDVMRQSGPHAAYMADCLTTAALTDDAALRARLLERVESVRAAHVAPVPQKGDMEFYWGNPLAVVSHQGTLASGTLMTQPPEGGWRFETRVGQDGVFKGMDYAGLGYDGEEGNGLTARKAWLMLQAARLTGDARLLEGGLKALRTMEHFRVPRAAQVWEVVAHAPDILAAADACEAYLEGYRITGDRHWLERAVYWGTAGIPFIYQWGVDAYPWLRHASIPIFGSTWWTCTWFGHPVQWNGLRWAYAVLKLAEYDQSYPWRTLAAGVTVSAMYQQGTTPGEETFCLWPDAYNAITGERANWDFAPQMIISNVHEMMGYLQEPRTLTIASGDGTILVHACAELRRGTLVADTLTVEAHLVEPFPSRFLIVGISEPTEVRAGGTVLPNVDFEGLEAPGWAIDRAAAAIVVVPPKCGDMDLVLRGVKARRGDLCPQVMTEIHGEFDATAEGWRREHDLADLVVRDGILYTQSSGADPYMTRSHCQIEGSNADRIRVRIAVSRGTMAQLFWTTSTAPEMSEERKIEVPLMANDAFHELVFEVGMSHQWAGKTMTSIRLDPTNAAAAEIRIDWIRSE